MFLNLLFWIFAEVDYFIHLKMWILQSMKLIKSITSTEYNDSNSMKISGKTGITAVRKKNPKKCNFFNFLENYFFSQGI